MGGPIFDDVSRLQHALRGADRGSVRPCIGDHHEIAIDIAGLELLGDPSVLSLRVDKPGFQLDRTRIVRGVRQHQVP
jgi:hypothetical protein